MSNFHVNDADLVARARDGDRAAFGDLVERHQASDAEPTAASAARRTDADDVAQEAFLLAYRRLGSFRGEASFKTWLLTITWNQAMNHRRTSGRWWRRLVSVDTDEREAFESSHFASPAATPEELVAGGEMRDGIRAAITGLPPKLRDALLLAVSGAYTYDEMGAMLKSPQGTIKWRVSEARRLVRQALAAQGHR